LIFRSFDQAKVQRLYSRVHQKMYKSSNLN